MKVYIASRTRYAKNWQRLRRAGVEIISSWIDLTDSSGQIDFSDLAVRCVEEIKNADRLVLYCQDEDILRGALIETGAALAANIPIYQFGVCASHSAEFASHPLWHQARSLDEAIGAKIPEGIFS